MKTFLNRYALYHAILRAPEDGGGSGGGDTAPTPAATTVLGGEAPAPTPGPGAADLMYPEGQKPGEEAKPGDGEKPAGEWKEYVNDPAKTAEENAAAKAEHDKTKPADPAADDKDKKKEGEEDKAKDAPKPEDYDLSPPEGFDVDPEVEKEFRTFASENGFSKETVGKLKDLQVKLYEKQSAAHAERVAQWGEELKTNKEIGGQKYDENVGVARAAIREFFPEGAKKMLDATGLGNHPDIVVGFVRMGRAMGEGRTLTGNPTGKLNIVDAMYGNE